jgi:hypothetical protein
LASPDLNRSAGAKRPRCSLATQAHWPRNDRARAVEALDGPRHATSSQEDALPAAGRAGAWIAGESGRRGQSGRVLEVPSAIRVRCAEESSPNARGSRPSRPDSGAREPESQVPALPAARQQARPGTPGAQRLAPAPQANRSPTVRRPGSGKSPQIGDDPSFGGLRLLRRARVSPAALALRGLRSGWRGGFLVETSRPGAAGTPPSAQPPSDRLRATPCARFSSDSPRKVSPPPQAAWLWLWVV